MKTIPRVLTLSLSCLLYTSSHMNTRYDVAIIGCGEAGIFAGYELMHRNPGLKVVTLDLSLIHI